jgi:hypothetical protein
MASGMFLCQGKRCSNGPECVLAVKVATGTDEEVARRKVKRSFALKREVLEKRNKEAEQRLEAMLREGRIEAILRRLEQLPIVRAEAI